MPNAGILVTGGTGSLGSELVPRLVTSGYDVRVLSRRENPLLPVGARAVRGDLTTGEGLDDAASGVDIIAHCATAAADLGARGLMYRPTVRNDVEPTRTLLEVARKHGSPWFIYTSIVGIDEIPLGYYRGKLDCERAIETSGLHYTIFRSTQWHTLAWELCRRLTKSPLVMVPKGVRGQLLDPGEVADRVISLIDGDVRGRAPDMGGPAALGFRDIVRPYLHATGKRRVIVEVPVPGKAVRGFREGHNLTPEHADGKITWAEWLEQHAPSSALPR